MGFFGFLRSGEFTVPNDTAFDPTCHLTAEDIAVDNYQSPSMVQVNIKQSKTDPFRKGVRVYIGYTGNDLCPVSALLSYLTYRSPNSGPLFQFLDGKPLTCNRLVGQLRAALAAAGIDWKQYSGHSFRIGAATTAAA